MGFTHQERGGFASDAPVLARDLVPDLRYLGQNCLEVPGERCKYY